MNRIHLAPVAAALLLAAATPACAQTYTEGETHGSEHHAFRVVTVAEGLATPWSMAWLPNGDMLVTERGGQLRIVRNGRLLPDPVAGIPAVLARGQGGLLDVVPHPDFANNRLLYISYSKPIGDGTEATTAVVRGRFENDRFTVVDEIFEAASRGNGHYGSRIVFDGEGHVFITVGDRQVPSRGDLTAHPAQDLSDNHGTINRLNEDGGIPRDNPFVGQDGARGEIWSYGHRNAQGMARNPETGDLWATEHGPQGGDEVNLILPGLNYGWPVIGFGVNYRSGTAIHEGTHREGMEQPAHLWVPSIGTSGLMFYTGDAFPMWKGSLFAGGLAGERVVRLILDGQEIVGEEDLLRGIGRVRDVRQGPDGFVYVAIERRDDQPSPIVRLEPVR